MNTQQGDRSHPQDETTGDNYPRSEEGAKMAESALSGEIAGSVKNVSLINYKMQGKKEFLPSVEQSNWLDDEAVAKTNICSEVSDCLSPTGKIPKITSSHFTIVRREDPVATVELVSGGSSRFSQAEIDDFRRIFDQLHREETLSGSEELIDIDTMIDEIEQKYGFI